MPHRSTSEISFIINNAERKALRSSRRSSMIGWDMSLEDVQVRLEAGSHHGALEFLYYS